MNLLTYFSLRKYGLRQACQDMAQKSVNLLLKEWREHGHVHENYHGDTGEGCDSPHSDAFYHWGGLLGIPALIEAGYLPAPELPLA
jgi:putative isomerase